MAHFSTDREVVDVCIYEKPPVVCWILLWHTFLLIIRLMFASMRSHLLSARYDHDC